MREPVRGASFDATHLALASLGSGALAYVVFAVVTRALGSDAAAPVAVVWTWWSLAAAAIAFPIQHWLTRTVAAYGGFRAARNALGPLTGAAIVATVATGVLAWVARDQLFHDDGVAFPLVIAALTLGSALMGIVRGGLGARQQFGALALTLLAENGARCVGVALLFALGVRAPAAYGAVIAAALLAGFLWPGALRFPMTGRTGERRAALALMSGASSGQLLAQVVLTAGPVVLAALGGAPEEITALFLGLAVYRAPYLVALGITPQLTGRFTQLVVEHRERELARARRVLVVGTVALGIGAVGVGLWIGPPLVRAVFGSDVHLPVWPSAALAVGSVFAVANLIASVMVIAYARTGVSAPAWIFALSCAAVVLLTDYNALTHIAAGFLIAEVTAFVVLLGATVRPARG